MGRGRFVGATAGGLLLIAAAGLPAVNSLGAEPQPPFTPAERAAIGSLALAALPPLPADPTNRFADDPAAAALGATLFFDQRLSANGKVACATCHKIDRQFQDDLPLGEGLGTANRRTMPLAGAAWKRWFFWDGRKDSLWSQALSPLENAAEQAGNRKAQVGTGERSEKIRTYNFPQDRVTDHRVKVTKNGLPAILAGDLDDFTAALEADEKRRKLEQASVGAG